jgi:hypothetical protein
VTGSAVGTDGRTTIGGTVGDKGFFVGIVCTGELPVVVEKGAFDGKDNGERVNTTGPGEGWEVGLEVGLMVGIETGAVVPCINGVIVGTTGFVVGRAGIGRTVGLDVGNMFVLEGPTDGSADLNVVTGA